MKSYTYKGADGVWNVVDENESVVAICYTPNTAHFISAALEDYDGQECPVVPGMYLAAQTDGELWSVSRSTPLSRYRESESRVICQCAQRSFAYFIAALYNSVLV